MNVVIVRSGLSHGFETPVGSGRSGQIEELIMEFPEGSIRGLAAERVATDLHERG
jgi:hypothetical protein